MREVFFVGVTPKNLILEFIFENTTVKSKIIADS